MKKIKIPGNKISNRLGGISVRRKRLLAIGGLFIIGLIAVVVFIFLNRGDPNSKENEPNPKNPPVAERNVRGGDPNQVIKYHEEAIAAWNSGNKEKAKDLAQKGLNLNDQLTNDQQAKIPDQPNKVYDMYDITKGSYEAD